MKLRSLVLAGLLTAGLYTQAASATPIAFFSDSITTASNTELGRPSRNGQPQTWTHEEAFPGVLSTSTGTTYFYNTYTISNSLFNPNNYLDISFTDELASGLLFISAYSNSYNPNARDQNWLGDLGFASNSYGPNSLFFDVVMPAGQDLVLVVNTTGGGTVGTGRPFDVAINGYTDTEYHEADITPYVAPAPEPSTFVELGTALVAVIGIGRRRFFAAA
ncbi:hypothetical protein [Terriglobus sp.]|uniref:hypothetical protein n=1 Tax=Terriglobus sp. TaxID=1889013 RepID=UPI003AFF9E07